VGLASPQAIVVVEAVPAASRRVGCRRGSNLARRPFYLAGAEKQQRAGFFRCHPTWFVPPASRPFLPPGGAMRWPGLRWWPGLPYPMHTGETWVGPRPYLQAPLQGQVGSGSPALGLGRGHRGQAADTARPPNMAAEAESSAEQMRDTSAAARPTPCAALGCNARPSLKGSVSIRIPAAVLAGGHIGNRPRRVWCWKPVPALAPRPLGAPLKGAGDQRGRRLGAAAAGGAGGRCSNASPSKASGDSADQPEKSLPSGAGNASSGWAARQPFSGAPRFTFAWVQTIRP